jgi:hypothetical protein
MKHLIKVGVGMLLTAVVLVAITSLFMRAHAAEPAPELASEKRDLPANVVNIVMNGPIDLELKQAPTVDMQVRGEPGMLARVTTRVEGNTLYIGTRGVGLFLGMHKPLKVQASLPALEKLEMQGSGDARVAGFRGNRAELTMHGSGDLRFDGDYQQLLLRQTGSGDVNLGDTNADSIDLSMHGSGDATLRGQVRSLSATLFGSGELDSVSMKAAQVKLQSGGSGNARIYVTQDADLHLRGSGDVHVSGKPVKRNAEHSGSGQVFW